METSTTAVQPTPVEASLPVKATKSTIKDLIGGEEFKSAIGKALPKHLTPDRFIRVALTALTKTPKLQDCDKSSFFSALLTLSQLGIEPDGRRAHLIPFENRKRGVCEVQLIIDYKGIAELVMRSGTVSSLYAATVHEKDDFEFDRGVIKKHTVNLREDRGPVFAVYAIAKMKDGSELCDVMSRQDIEAIRTRSRSGQSGPWVTDWNEMAKKTVFKRLAKWLPLSPEFRDAVEADDDLVLGDIKNVTPTVSRPLFSAPQPQEQIIDAPAPETSTATEVA